MDLTQLHYAVAVADEGSFTAAAQALHVAQSGVSAQVARLEREIGVRLFHRRARGVGITPAGAVVVDRIRAALVAVDAVESAAAEVRGLMRGSVRVGAVAGLAWPAFIDALGQVRAEHPGLDLSLREGISADLQAAVIDGHLDLAVVSWVDDPAAGLTAWVALREQLAAFVAPGHAWADRTQVSPRDLLTQDLVCTTRGTGIRAAFEHLMRTEGLPAPVRWDVTLPTTARTLAARSLGVAVLTTSRADPPHNLVRVPIRSAHADSMLGVVWRSRPEPSAATRAVLLAMRQNLVQDNPSDER